MPEPLSAPQKDGLEEIDLKSGGERLLNKPKGRMGGAGDAEAVYVAGTEQPLGATMQPFLHFNVGKMYFEFTRIQVYSAGAIITALVVIIITVIAVSCKSSDRGDCKNCTSENPVDRHAEHAGATRMEKKWFEKGPLAELPDSSWREVGERLQQLQVARVRGAFVGSALTRDRGNASLKEFEDLAATANRLGIRIIVTVVCGHVERSHDWFARSERREPPYDDYFVWANGTRETPPNNWKNGTNSAWAWSETRGAYYLHRQAADTADLNLRNPAVRKEVGSWLDTWMRAGAAGVRLPTVRRLLVDAELRDESGVERGEGCGERTCDQPDLADLMAEWRAVVRNSSEEALFTVGEDVLSNGTLAKSSLVDIPLGPLVRLDARADAIEEDLSVLKSPPRWPAVKLEVSNLMEESWMVGLMLPAVPIFAWEQIAIMFQNQTNGRRAVYESALGMRERMLDADLPTQYRYHVASIRKVAAVFTRWRDDGGVVRGYVVAVRPQFEEEKIDLRGLEPKPFPDQLTAALLSSHYDNSSVPLNSTVKSDKLYMVEQCAIILTFNT